MGDGGRGIPAISVAIVDTSVNTDCGCRRIDHSSTAAAPLPEGAAGGPEVANLPLRNMKTHTDHRDRARKQLSTTLFALSWRFCRTCMVQKGGSHG
jgi:hypothetical protein